MNGSWAEPDVRDEVVDYVRYWSDKTGIKATKMIRWVKITRSKYYDWLNRYGKVKEQKKSAHNLNSTKVRKMLVECGVTPNLVDRIVQTYETTDDAHHSGKDYTTVRQRLREYHAWVHELAGLLD